MIITYIASFSGGVTVQLLHGSANPIGGQSAPGMAKMGEFLRRYEDRRSRWFY